MTKNKIELIASIIILCLSSVVTLFPLIGIIFVSLMPTGQPTASIGFPTDIHFENFIFAWCYRPEYKAKKRENRDRINDNDAKAIG